MDEWKRLLQQAQAAAKGAREIAEKADAEHRKMTVAENREYGQQYKLAVEKKAAADQAKNAEANAIVDDLSKHDGNAPDDDSAVGASVGRKGAVTTPQLWAAKAARAIARTGQSDGVKAVVSGSLGLPSVLVEAVSDPKVARRFLELIPQPPPLGANNFGYIRQTVRQNNATAVADHATKPTSVFTFEEVEDRARVVAHLSEPIPLRFMTDHAETVALLQSEMAYGLLLGVEDQALTGDGAGENMTGVLGTTGIGQVAFSTDLPTTLRKARTFLDVRDEQPNAWVFNPADAETLDLLREDGATGDFLSLEDRILGRGITFVVSNALQPGQALLGDWSQCRLWVREGSRLDLNAGGGDLFDKNEVKLRSEGRYGFGVLRPQAIAVVDLAAG